MVETPFLSRGRRKFCHYLLTFT